MLESSSSLFAIDDLHLVGPLAHYGRFKIGDPAALASFAAPLADSVLAQIERLPASGAAWVLTSPPAAELPAAANLLCAAVHNRLCSRTDAVPVTLVELRRESYGGVLGEAHYGGRTPEGRRAYMDRAERSWHRNESLDGAHVLFVNDVRVTGTQEDYQRQCFEAWGVARVHWQYLIMVTVPDAEGAARLEEPLNHAGLNTDEFIAAAADPGLTITTKFVWRLFSLDDSQFSAAVGVMATPIRRRVFNAVSAQEPPTDGRFAERLRFLRGRLQGVTR
jgi:hypothetical protein